MGGIHIKDCFPDFLPPQGGDGMSYQEAQATKRLWAEPGRGVVDFGAVVAAIPPDYDGDFMIEVDEPSVESKRESHRISFEWARQNLPAVAS
jgi:inosose dehydratase